MGGVGFTEMLLLAVVLLIVVGPEKLPKLARAAGKLSRQARNAWQGLQSELQAELDADHNRKIMQAHPDADTPKPGADEHSTPGADTPPGPDDEPRDEQR